MSNMASATISGELTRGRRTNPVDHHSPGRCNGGKGSWASQCPRWPMRREDAPETLHLRTPSLPPPGGRARFPPPAGEGQGGGGAASAMNGRCALPKPGPIRAVEIMQNVSSHPGLGRVRPGITRCIILLHTVVTFRSSPPPQESITASTIEISLSSHNECWEAQLSRKPLLHPLQARIAERTSLHISRERVSNGPRSDTMSQAVDGVVYDANIDRSG